MKKSLSIVLSLLLTCVILLTSCNNTIPDIPPAIEETEATSPIENIENTEDIKNIEDSEKAEEPQKAEEPEKSEENKSEVEPEVIPDVEITVEPEEEPEVTPEIEPEEPTVETDQSEITEDGVIEDEVEDDEGLDEEINIDIKDEDTTEAVGKLQDNMPAAKSYTGIMHYPTTSGKTISCNVDFVVDYKMLIDGNNKTYSKDLAKLSALYASDIYKDLYIEFTSGATGGSDTTTNFGKKLGLQNPKSYTVSASSYSVDKDDITQFFVGHKNIIYKENKKWKTSKE